MAFSTQNFKSCTVGGYSSIVANGLLRMLSLARVILEVGYIVVLCNILVLKKQVPIKGVKYVCFSSLHYAAVSKTLMLWDTAIHGRKCWDTFTSF